MMDTNLPGLVVTGASGFVGRNVLASLANRYRLFCLARRSPREAGIPEHDNLRWSQVDVAEWDTMREVVDCIKRHGGASTMLHLAGYYDFQNMEHPEYERTNVGGTRNALELASQLGVDRFIFASSLAACRFPEPGQVITEETPVDADFAYARSKRAGEQMVREHADRFSVAIVRMAAMFSDWCEYPPLYVFMRTWLSQDWNARILAGRGESSVPYLHIADLVRLFHIIAEQSATLPREVVLNASPNTCTTHRELYDAVTHGYFSDSRPPTMIPSPVARIGVAARWWLGRLRGQPPFEAPWMVEYIARQLRVDATRTHALMNWRPTPRLHVARRMMVMIENMKTYQGAWIQRNEATLYRIASRPNLQIAAVLDEIRDDLIGRIADIVGDPANAGRFCNYQEMERAQLEGVLRLFYQVVVTAVRTGDRRLVRQFAQIIAQQRRDEGFAANQVQAFLRTIGRLVFEALQQHPRLATMDQAIHDHVMLGFELAIDDVEDAYDMVDLPLLGTLPRYRGLELPSSAGDLERLIRQLEDVCGDGLPRA
jgi:nucleoside-diphosphate-sugar epimerase